MTRRADIAVVGGGILGLAHAFVLARSHKRVVLFERGRSATGASVRNFGMIWPIGQPAGEMHQMALRSRELWFEALNATRLSFRPTGSLHVAHHPDEAEVLREFAEIGPPAGYECCWLNTAEASRRSQALESENLQGALWSGTEMTVDPRDFAAAFGAYLRETGVECRYGSAVKKIELPVVETSQEREAGSQGRTKLPAAGLRTGAHHLELAPGETAPGEDFRVQGFEIVTGANDRRIYLPPLLGCFNHRQFDFLHG